jgi:hypothetical protein
MTEQAHPQRGLAGAFALCALATLVLLTSHPAPAARGLAELLQAEGAGHRHAVERRGRAG